MVCGTSSEKSSFGPFDLDLWSWPGTFSVLRQADWCRCTPSGAIYARLAVNEKNCVTHRLKNRVIDPFDLDVWPWPGILFVLSQAGVDAHFLVQFGRNRSVKEKVVRYTVWIIEVLPHLTLTFGLVLQLSSPSVKLVSMHTLRCNLSAISL